MNTFTDVCRYVASKPSDIFSSYEEALAAYNKSITREKARECLDTLEAFHMEYHEKYRKAFKRIPYQKWYDFNEVKAFLKAEGLYGGQVFDCRGYESGTWIYGKGGTGITILHNEDYGYYEVLGLLECDYKVLEKAHEARYYSKE